MHHQDLKDMADEMGIALYSRFEERGAAEFLELTPLDLKEIREKGAIAYLEVMENRIEYFGYQLLEYLVGTISPRKALASSSSLPYFPVPDHDGIEQVLRIQAVQNMTGLSRTTIWRREKAQEFPARITLGGSSVGWKLTEVQRWIETNATVDTQD